MNRLTCGLAALYVVVFIFLTAPLASQTKSNPNGREIFRYDTFGDEQLWTDVLGLHEAIASVSPATALSVGLKVDVESLRPRTVRALESGQFDINGHNPVAVHGQKVRQGPAIRDGHPRDHQRSDERRPHQILRAAAACRVPMPGAVRQRS